MDIVLVTQVITAGIPRDIRRGHETVLIVLVIGQADRKVARERDVDRRTGVDQIVRAARGFGISLQGVKGTSATPTFW